MTDYVAGFLFNANKDEVVLVEKQKPTWQKGRLNAVGGKIEPMESISQAMTREFQEETGVRTSENCWKEFCSYTWEDGLVHFFYCVNEVYFHEAITVEEEKILKLKVGFVLAQHRRIIYNLKWLIPLALDPSLNFEKNGPIIIRE